MDEIKRGTHIMDGLYELQQSDTGETVKQFQSQFEPPEENSKVIVARFSECSPLLMPITDAEESPILKACEITEEDINGLPRHLFGIVWCEGMSSLYTSQSVQSVNPVRGSRFKTKWLNP